MKTIGIDIGSSTSPMALAVLEDGEIIETKTLKQKGKVSFYHFLLDVFNFISENSTECSRASIEETYYHGIQFVNKRGQKKMMPLKSANQRHQRLIGTVVCGLVHSVRNMEIVMIAPTSIKKRVGGSGKSDKIQVAKGASSIVSNGDMVIDLIGEKRFDETDAIAIALAGFMEV